MERILNSIFNLRAEFKFFSIIIAFLAPLATLIHLILLLLLVDMLTSIYYQMTVAAAKAGKGKRFHTAFLVIESRRLRKTLEKMFFYVLTIIVFYSFDSFVLKIEPISNTEIWVLSITNISAALISLVEITSIAANVSKITGNPVFNRIVSIFSKKVEKKLEIDEE